MDTIDDDALRLDGNAAAGPLQEVFAREVTAAGVTCASCGTTRPLGADMAYLHAPGLVLRCAGCGAVLLRLVHGGGRFWLDLAGMRCLELAEA